MSKQTVTPGIIVPKSVNSGITRAIAPVIIQSKQVKARIDTGEKHHGSTIFVVDHRALERNKYAPWGRGHLSGLPV